MVNHATWDKIVEKDYVVLFPAGDSLPIDAMRRIDHVVGEDRITTDCGIRVYRSPVRSADDLDLVEAGRDPKLAHVIYGHFAAVPRHFGTDERIAFRNPIDLSIWCQKNRVPVEVVDVGLPSIGVIHGNWPWEILNSIGWVEHAPTKLVKVFGERRTGTNAMARTLSANFRVQVCGYGYLGWKHRIAPSRAEFLKLARPDTSIVVMVRHPVSWLLSLYRRPFHMKARSSFSQFIRSPANDSRTDGWNIDYQNPIIMWNLKYRSYLEMERFSHLSVVRTEDFQSRPQRVIDQLGDHLGLPLNGPAALFANKINEIGAETGSRVAPDNRETLMKEVSASDRRFIARELDWDLFEELGYQPNHDAFKQEAVDGPKDGLGEQ